MDSEWMVISAGIVSEICVVKRDGVFAWVVAADAVGGAEVIGVHLASLLL